MAFGTDRSETGQVIFLKRLKMSNIDIEIIGGANKSHIIAIIKKALRANGLMVEHDASPDFKNESHFDKCIDTDNHIALSHIKEKCNIYIREKQKGKK